MTRKAVETGALWKPWKNGDIKQTTLGVEFFHRSHNAWKTPPDGVSHRFYDEIHPPKNETPRLQKCNLCAREKLLPMNRELQNSRIAWLQPLDFFRIGKCFLGSTQLLQTEADQLQQARRERIVDFSEAEML